MTSSTRTLYGQHDPMVCLVNGLFRSTKDGERNILKIDAMFGDAKLEIRGAESLGADDLRVLQGLVAMAGLTSGVLDTAPRHPVAKALRAGLQLTDDATTRDAIVVFGSYYRLAFEIGYKCSGGKISSGVLDDLRCCIERLWRTTIIIERKVEGRRQRLGFNLLSSYAGEETANRRGRLRVALNPQITAAIMGRGRWSYLDMTEVRTIKREATRILHHHLCGLIDPGQTKRVGMDTMIGYVNPVAASGSTLRMRRSTIRAALTELRGMEWTADEYAAGRFSVSRPPRSAYTSEH
jgi:hypothetical protein